MKTTTIKNVIELHLLSSKKKTKSVFNATARFRRISNILACLYEFRGRNGIFAEVDWYAVRILGDYSNRTK